MKNRKKRILSGLLCLVMSLTLLPTVAMAAGRFTDVKEKDWFYTDVEYAVEQGLVNGTTPTTYSPNSNLTYGSAIKLAACMHKKVTQGSTDFTVGSPWYQVYVDYAQANGIIPAGKTYDWNANATRAGYMEIFANAIPDTGLKNGYTELSAINKVDDGAIPDVPATHPQAVAIYKLYRAGILQGDETHKCSPDNYIRRSEVAAILTRMMNADARICFEMTSGETSSASVNGLTITQQPADAAAALGEKAQFTVEVSGGKSPYTYKWYSSADGASWTAIVNSSQYSGGATAALTVKVNASTPLNYRCEITDASRGKVTSNTAKLTVGASTLAVTQQPKDETCKAGNQAAFTVAVSGGKAPYTYQWQIINERSSRWVDLSNSDYVTGAKTSELWVIVMQQDFEAGYQYRCVITDANGSVVYSNAARAIEPTTPTRPTVTTSTPKITQQPKDETCKAGNQAAFTVAVSGGKAPYTYQWQIINERSSRWVDLSNSDYVTGAKTSELWVIVMQQDFEAGYQYRCVITDANGSVVYSNAARAIEPTTPTRPTVTTSTPKITQQPKDVTCAVGDTASFTVTVSGGKAPYTYQWQWRSKDDDAPWADFSDYADATGVKTNALEVVVMQVDFSQGYQYHCVITDANGNSVTSDAVTVIKSASTLTISQQPKSASAAAGKSVILTVEISGGTSPVAYQWQYSTDKGETWQPAANSTKYSGVSTAKLTVKIDSLRTDSALTYRCKISDAAHAEVYTNSVTATATANFQRH